MLSNINHTTTYRIVLIIVILYLSISCLKKDTVQFLPYGRSIGSWICLTHKTYTCHRLQCCACRLYIFFFFFLLCTTTQNVHEESWNGSSQLFYSSLQHVVRAHSSGRFLQHVMRAHSSGRVT
jgi:hypothetical protein